MDNSYDISSDVESSSVGYGTHNEEFDYSTLFVNPETGEGYVFHIHSSIEGDRRTQLSDEIEQYGGQLSRTERRVDTILVKETLLNWMKGKYETSTRTYVEPPSFIRRCKSKKRYEHDRIARFPMGGSRPSREAFVQVRTPFTAEDDRHLVKYLYRRLPFKDSGGRGGNGVYKELILQFQEYGNYPWAERHTWQSWRERYNKRQDVFDERIDELVRRFPPPANGKGQYHLDRRVNRKQPVIIDGQEDYQDSVRRSGHKPNASEEEEEEEEEEDRREEEEEEFEMEHQSERRGVRSSVSIPPPPIIDSLEYGRGKRERSPSLSIRNDYVDDDYVLLDDGGVPEIELGDVFSADQQMGDKGKQRLTPPSSQARPRSTGANTMPFNTQMTLVGTPTGPINTSTPRTLSSSARRSARKLASTATVNAENAHTAEPHYTPLPESSPFVDIVVKRNALKVQPEVVITPRNPSSGPVRNTRARSRARDDQNITSIPPVRASSHTRGRRGTIPTAQDAPYRNTRARSTSVEPVPLSTTQRFRSNKQVITKSLSKRGRSRAVLSSVKENMELDLEPVEEIAEIVPEDNFVIHSANEDIAGAINVSQEEELQVEGALALRPEEDEYLRHATREEQDMDSDDDATETSLANHAKNRLLGNLLQARSAASSPVQRSVKSSQYVKLETPSQVLQKGPVPPPTSRLREQTRRQVRERSNSDTGVSTEVEGSFPIRNTKARVAKDKMDEEAKKKPFNPAFGTRAAEIALSQNLNRGKR